MSEEEKVLNKEKIRCTSTDTSILDENYIVRELHDEIDYLNQKLRDYPQYLTERDGREKKTDLCSMVRRLRINLILVDPSWATDRLTKVTEDIDEELNNQEEIVIESISDELNNSFYTLECELKGRGKQFVLPFSRRQRRIHLEDSDQDFAGAGHDEDIEIQFPNRMSYGMSAMGGADVWG